MKVGILSDIADTRGSGPGNIMHNLIKGVREESPHDIVWIHTVEADSDLKDNGPHRRVPDSAWRSALQLREEDFDILHLDCISKREMLVYPFMIDATFMATQYGDVHLAEKHIWPHSTFDRYKKKWAQRLLQRFYAAITVLSESSKSNFVSAGFPGEKFHVVSPGLDRGYQGIEPLPREDRDDVLFHVSHFQPVRKNPALLLQAFEQVRAAGHDVELKIAGSGWTEDFVADQVEEGETRENITLLGHVPNQELKELYRSSLAFLVPTRHEGFPIPPMEAMACGTPVVSTNVYAVPETIGGAGILVEDPDDVEEFARATESLLEDAGLWQELSEKSRERVEKLIWEDSAKKIADIYDSFDTG